MGSAVQKYKLAFVTGSRADYGIMRRYLTLLNEDKDIDLDILATGALLDERYGSQVSLIEDDGFTIAARIELPLDTESNTGVAKAMAVALEAFADYFTQHTYDLLLILGDRYEVMSVAIAAAMNRIPILHIHGGEATFANYDEFIRHSITKMSLFHFTATEEYRQRVIQLGEAPERVFNLGALGAENCLEIDESKVPQEVKGLEPQSYYVMLFHPETIGTISAQEQVDAVLGATDMLPDAKFIFLGSNADTHANIIRKGVAEYVATHANALYFENLPTAGYHHLLKNAIALVGNSSSGLIEAPTLGTYTINLGSRQDGRVRGDSVKDIPFDATAIAQAMRDVAKLAHPAAGDNPYYQPNCANRYFETTRTLLGRLPEYLESPKEFYDLSSHDTFQFEGIDF